MRSMRPQTCVPSYSGRQQLLNAYFRTIKNVQPPGEKLQSSLSLVFTACGP